MEPVRCCTEGQLRAFLLGELSEEQSQAVTEHLERCPACEALADRLEGLADWMVLDIRQAVGGSAAGPPPPTEAPGGEPAVPASARVVTWLPPPPGAHRPDRDALPVLPGYEVLDELGRGGMGIVYKARQSGLNRVVAVKTLPEGASAEVRARFRVEAEAVARLQHPNIVAVHEVGGDSRKPFLVMEFIDGGNLTARLAGTPLPPGEAARLVEQLARAVGYAHGRQVLHRDLKPANVLLTGDGIPKIADFGLARLLSGGEDLTRTGVILGTPSYMSPEQARGGSEPVGPATDVYALGAILYECLTGRPPFKGVTELETLTQVADVDPVSPRQLQPAVPRDLETIVLKCLRKDPGHRYPSALALAEDLRRFQAGQPVVARPVGTLERTWRWCRRHPAVAGLSAAVALLLTVLTVGSWLKNAELRQALKGSNEARRKADHELWRSYLAEARAVRLSGRPGQRLRGLAAIRKALDLPVSDGHSLDQLRTEAIACLCLPDVEELRRWEGAPEGTIGLSFDAALETYTQARPSGEVIVRRTADDTVVAHFHTSLRPELRLSPDARFVLVEPSPVDGAALELWKLADGQWIRCVSEPSAITHFAAFSPDGRFLAYQRGDWNVVVHDLEAGRPVAEWPLPSRGMFLSLAFSHDGRRLALGFRDGEVPLIQIRKVPTGEVLACLPQPGLCAEVVWHPDGERLLVGGDDHLIHLWDVGTETELASWEGHTKDGIQFLAIDRRGRRLASYDHNARLRVWDVESGQQLFSMPFARPGFWTVRPRQDGEVRLVCQEGRHLQLLRLIDGREYRKLTGHSPSGRERQGFVAISRDHRLIAIGTEDDSEEYVSVEDMETGRRLAVLPGASLRGAPLGFDRSGGLLVNDLVRPRLVRWAVRQDPANGTIHFGPPRRVLWEAGENRWTGHWGASADGRVIAFPVRGVGAVVVSLDRPGQRVTLRDQADVRNCGVSPDGRFVATGGHHVPPGQSGCRVWSATDGRPLRKLPLWPGGTPVFSPDGTWLGIGVGGQGTLLWQIPSGEPGPLLDEGPSEVAFAPDGRTVAVGGESAVRLCLTASGRELARLEIPDQTRLHPIAFSHDGVHLFALDTERTIHAWDLRRIRRGLAELGLDWDAAALPDPPTAPAPKVRVEVDPGAAAHFHEPPDETPQQRAERCSAILRVDPDDVTAWWERGVARVRLGQDEAAAADLERALALQENLPDVLNLLARIRLRGGERVRDPKKGWELAKRAAHLAPTHPGYQGTLGMALYHNDRFADAVAPLERCLEGQPGLGAALHLFYLAMCQQRLGDPARARGSYDRAVRWRDAQKSLSADQARLFNAYRADAARVLGLGAQ
jgi:WD40 repeat protein/Tfp pilus assembly protein PilF